LIIEACNAGAWSCSQPALIFTTLMDVWKIIYSTSFAYMYAYSTVVNFHSLYSYTHTHFYIGSSNSSQICSNYTVRLFATGR
jgi:hypothetical protein